MFARSVSIALLALPILVSAASLPRGGPPASIENSCNTGELSCCDDVQDAQSLDKTALGLLHLLGIDVGAITAKVGLTCNPISVIAVAGTSCSKQPVCCTNNSFDGVVALGCNPINLNV